MALKSLYRVCEIKKLDLIFSSFSVRSQNHSYKNSIVFRLARHLCSSTLLVTVNDKKQNKNTYLFALLTIERQSGARSPSAENLEIFCGGAARARLVERVAVCFIL